MQRRSLFLALFVCLSGMAGAQTTTKVSTYDPHQLFGPWFYPQGNSITRSSDGSPNLVYWQNRADYKIDVSLNEESHEISGAVTITYKK